MRWSFARAIAVGVLCVVGLIALGTGASRRFFDYDEIYHAHATWQIAAGLRPFHDFQASHTPFLWYPLATAWRALPDAPSSLIPLRYGAALVAVLSVVVLTASFAASRPDVPATWRVVGVCAVACDRDILDFALEFRPDSWSVVVLFVAFVLLLTGRPRQILGRYALFTALAAIAIVSSPKLVLLPVIFTVFDLGRRWHRREDFRPAFIGSVAGLGVAWVVASLFLLLVHVDQAVTVDMAILYQWTVVSESGYGRGLLSSVVARPKLLVLVTSGVVAWVAHLVITQRRPHTYELAVVAFLVAQLLIGDRPYKQYYAPWFLIGAGFLPFLGLVLERHIRATRLVAFPVVVVFCGWTSWAALDSFARQTGAREMLDFHATLLGVSPVGAAVVAYPPLHPVVRRNVFYAWSRTTDPAGRGTEAIMASLQLAGYSERFVRDYYDQELRRNPPAVIVAPRDANWGYEPGQWAAIKDYLAAHNEEYGFVDRGVLQPFWFRREAVDGPAVRSTPGASR